MAAVTLMKGNAPPEGLSGFGDVDYRQVGNTALKLASVAGLGYVTVESDLPGWARILTGLAALQQGMKLLRRLRGSTSVPYPDEAIDGSGSPDMMSTDDGTPIVSVPAGSPLNGFGASRKYRAANLRVRT